MLGVPMSLPAGLIDGEYVVDAGTVGNDGLSWLCCECERSVVSIAILYCSNLLFDQERPYHDDSTASRLLSEVKHRRARLVLRWGTTLESRVLFFCYYFLSQTGFHFAPVQLSQSVLQHKKLPQP